MASILISTLLLVTNIAQASSILISDQLPCHWDSGRIISYHRFIVHDSPDAYNSLDIVVISKPVIMFIQSRSDHSPLCAYLKEDKAILNTSFVCSTGREYVFSKSYHQVRFSNLCRAGSESVWASSGQITHNNNTGNNDNKKVTRVQTKFSDFSDLTTKRQRPQRNFSSCSIGTISCLDQHVSPN